MVALNLQVAAGNDDGTFDTSVGTCSLSGATTVGIVSFLSLEWHALLRFLSVAIPPGAVIDSAVIEIFALSSGSSSVTLRRVRGEATDNAPAFTGGDCYTGRTQTVASVPWTGIWLGSTVQLSPDLAAIVQEIIDRPGWASGNAMVLFINNDDFGSGFKFDNIESFDVTPASAAKLAINYTPPLTPGVVGAMGPQIIRMPHKMVGT